jgi:chromosome segregation protein
MFWKARLIRDSGRLVWSLYDDWKKDMHLKRLTVHGFKSFADKVVLTFDKGITGIVGPNGSGKSNVIDSVRWVMGEQNAKNLRGEKALDIIFAGSDKRKALTMAEVALTFDNTEDTGICPPEYRHEPEITLSRRLYADNEREYFINRKPCRLKDIVQFFALTGLGGRSYSMIQQGQVDRILNAKPEDVREILEEAAGTLVFKQRKIEAQKKLEETSLNLSRVEDILKEVEKQQSSLENQVEKAQQWTALSDEMRELELKLFAHNYHFFKEKLDTIDAWMATEQTKEVDILAQIASFQARYEELQQILADADPELAALNEEFTVARETLARAESAISGSLQKVASHEGRLKDLERELSEEDSNLKLLEEQSDRSAIELSQAETEAKRLRELIEDFQTEVDTVDESANVFKNKIAELEDEIRNIARLLDSNRFRHENSQRELEKNRQSKISHKERLDLLEAEAFSALEAMAKWETKAASQQEGLDGEIREKHARETLLAQSYHEMKDAQTSRDSNREKYHEMKARLISLEELVSSATDVAASWNILKDKEPAISDMTVGLLANHVSFNQLAQELPKKVLSAFEGWSERLIMTDANHITDVVRMCGRHNVGGIPVTVFDRSAGSSNQSIEKWSEDYGAEALVGYLNVDHAPAVVKELLGKVYLLQVLQLDKQTIEAIPEGLVVITPQGLMIHGHDDFLITGSATGGILSRKAEHEKLSVELKDVERSLAASQARIDELELRINECRQIVGDIDTKLQSQNKEVLAVMAELQSARQTAENKQELAGQSKKHLDELEMQEQQLLTDMEQLFESRGSMEREREQLEAEIVQLREEFASIDERREEIMRQNQQRQLELAKSEGKAAQLRDSRKLSHAQLELVQNKLSRRYEEQNRLRQEIEDAKHDYERAQGDIEGLILRREELQDRINEKRDANAGVHEELRVVDNKLRDCRDTQQKLQKQISEKNLEGERIRLGIESFLAQAQEKYQVDLKETPFVRDEDFNLDKAGRTVNSLRNKIEAIGPVNLMAMKEYEELGDRKSFITTQRDEILSSINVLNTAIQEIELTSKDKFSVIFEVINRNFAELFAILFPGGEAALELTNPEDPLAGGVELMVRLPGKTRKSMSLCSGGEKALTAISLIFALLKTKPTPFCFLDEVDAPLDEANVGRYNRVLEALSEQFQFVVITHNRRTMEVLDTLYGVTMQEGGVSTVVGVDMKKDLPAHLKKAFKDIKVPVAVPSRPGNSPVLPA